jgi:predicted nucleotidyltransferase
MNDLWIEKFRKEALPGISREFKPDKVIAFGSRIRGTAREESDIDVILVSSYFNDIPFLKRMPLVLRKVPFPKHVDYICYTSTEYERIKGESSIIMDAIENSIELEA